MESARIRRYATAALFLVAPIVALTAVGASPAGATEADPGCLLFTFAHVGPVAQAPRSIVPAACPTDEASRLEAWQSMEAAAAHATTLCGDSQVDLVPNVAPWSDGQVGVIFPHDTPGALSAITGIVGVGVCEAPPADTLVPAEVVEEAPPAPVVTPAPDATVDIGLTSTVVSAPGRFVVTALPATGSSTGPLVTAGALCLVLGGLVLGLGRRLF